MNKKSLANIIWIVLLVVGTVWILARHHRSAETYRTANGLIFGTVYNITYQYGEDLKEAIDAELRRFDGALSTFNDTSTISRINKNEDIMTDTLFRKVFRRAMQVSAQTDGDFDITVAPLVNAWGFGFRKGTDPSREQIDSMLALTGYQKITLTPEGRVVKRDPRIMLDCSAIAKGFAVDVIGNLLAAKGVKNFMVDIGGEVVLKGVNPQQEAWRIGVNKPIDDSLAVNKELELILQLTNVGIATSGNYRNYYVKGGKKYAHTIDPHTGYPVQHSILSSTVIAVDCMSADAYATSFMVMGLEKAQLFLAKHPEIDACFIYSDEKGNYCIWQSEGMKKYKVEEVK
jgi:thiamine biosynthesis lipoprotein